MKESPIDYIGTVSEDNNGNIDTLTMDIPLFLRLLEYAKEDAKTDLDSDENNNLLNKLNVILNNNYELKSEINGFVTNVLAETGTTTDENPVFYVQYAHARACSILRNVVNERVGGFGSTNKK